MFVIKYVLNKIKNEFKSFKSSYTISEIHITLKYNVGNQPWIENTLMLRK